MPNMPEKTEQPDTQTAGSEEPGRRYRSIAEIRRDFFPDAPASLFELGPGRRQEITPRLSTAPGHDH
jgi:hypothetical protein